jgi:metal-responsive CopG/Arc/MetJ family transcriptional regulator
MGKTKVEVGVSLTQVVIDESDRLASQLGLSRSAVIELALREAYNIITEMPSWLKTKE